MPYNLKTRLIPQIALSTSTSDYLLNYAPAISLIGYCYNKH